MQKIIRRIQQYGAFILGILRNYTEHECAVRSASLAYYGLFSVFPLILFLFYLGSQFLSVEETRETLNAHLEQLLPGNVAIFQAVIGQAINVRRSVGIISGIGLIWTASAVFSVLELGLNVVWESVPRPFVRRRLLGAAVVVLLSVLFLISVMLGPLLEFVLRNLGWDQAWVGPVVSFWAIALTCFLLFRYFPSRAIPWRPALAGAVLAGFLIEAAKHIFSYSLGLAMTNYGYIYGSLAWVIALVFWTYLVGLLFFLGAEFGAALERQLPS
jgi:membrane protein